MEFTSKDAIEWNGCLHREFCLGGWGVVGAASTAKWILASGRVCVS